MTGSDGSDTNHADCDDCDWHYASKDKGNVVRAEESHKRSTGHSVSTEYVSDGSDHPEYCPECSAKHWSETPSIGWYCKSCGYEPESDGSGPDITDLLENAEPTLYINYNEALKHNDGVEIVGAVPIAELEQLADEWKNKPERGESDNSYTNGLMVGYDAAADQLQELIADYGGTDE